MDLSNLPASELARLDAVCLDFESRLRKGEAISIAEWVSQHGGDNAAWLQRELESITEELKLDTTQPKPSGYFAPAELPKSGDQIGPYVIGDLVGRGGMGVVFQAVDPRLDRPVAIKMLKTEVANQSELTERFQREARAVASISHPNIVELFDVGSANGIPYAVMELLKGESLDAKLQQGALKPAEVRRIGSQIAHALATAHAAGVVHRDLKPQNIMLVSPPNQLSGQQSIAKLFDFGLSRIPRSQEGQTADETADGVIMGTPGYMSPEQTRGESVTPAADVFSLGCVLYEAMYGKPAFDGNTKAKRFAATLNDDPQPEPSIRRQDAKLAELVQRCLNKNPQERPVAMSIANALRSNPGTQADPVVDNVEAGYSAGQTTRRRLLELVAGGIAGAVFGVFYFGGKEGELANVRSIAVLSFNDLGKGDTKVIVPHPTQIDLALPEPVGTKPLDRGEQLAAMLVHELTRLSEVTVPRFRPLVAGTPAEIRAAGELLEVDALVTGSLRTLSQGSREFLEIDLQILSAETGIELWGKTIQTDAFDSLLRQSQIASDVATVIGQRLTSTGAADAPPSVESFNCLVDGTTRSDPDSLQGLEMALMCFQKAHDADRRFAEPVAGIALTSITLAAQSDQQKSIELIRQSRQHTQEALELDPNSHEARLAQAMLDWQTVGRYKEADREFKELVMVAPNHWQVRHQYGLLQLTLGQTTEALRSLREASQLNPMSVIVKVDRARAQWFSGNRERAIEDAIRIRDRYDNHLFARGLLVDIYEQQSMYREAAAEHTHFELANGDDANAYFQARADKLAELPYGPFGTVVNRAILQTRSEQGMNSDSFADLIEPTHPPMLPLILAAHPSMRTVKTYPRALELLDSNI